MKFSTVAKKTFVKRKDSNLHERFYRIISIPFVWLFLKIKLKPDIITLLSVVFSISALFFYISYSPYAILFYLLGIIMDHADGPISRISGISTKKGSLFDVLSDKIAFYSLLAGITIGTFLRFNLISILFIGFILLTTKEFSFYSNIFIQRIFNYEKINKKRATIKKKNFFLMSISTVVDTVYILFPFIILFPLYFVLGSYILLIMIDGIKLFWEIFLVVRTNQ